MKLKLKLKLKLKEEEKRKKGVGGVCLLGFSWTVGPDVHAFFVWWYYWRLDLHFFHGSVSFDPFDAYLSLILDWIGLDCLSTTRTRTRYTYPSISFGLQISLFLFLPFRVSGLLFLNFTGFWVIFNFGFFFGQLGTLLIILFIWS